jgi:hypothetical protein
MSATKSTTSDNGERVTSLAAGLKNDEPRDTRGCPHDCHGTLKLTEQDRVVCDGCRCTPEGVYIPLDDAEQYDGVGFSAYKPLGSDPENTDPNAWKHCNAPEYVDHDTYDNYPYNTRLAGGYEAVYDQDDQRRPNGVDESYTWDLSSSNYEKVDTGHEWINSS